MANVLIAQRIIPHYRVRFFVLLHDRLRREGIELKVAYGKERTGTIPASVDLPYDWAIPVDNFYLAISRWEVCWQPILSYASWADLVIVEHASRLLVNYAIQLRRKISPCHMAFWGHGANLRANNRLSISETIKRSLMGSADWWFAYTELSAALVRATGYPPSKITVVENSIDTTELREALGAVQPVERAQLGAALGINGPVGVFCGGMYAQKRLDFLLDCCIKIRQEISDFHFIFIGSGPEADKVRAACASHPWMHDAGPVTGAARAKFLSLADVMLMPGVVGLALIDSFVSEVPLFTTDIATHSPEIAYLENGQNGVIASNSSEQYVHAVIEYLRNPTLQARLKDACAQSGHRYSLENMVERFATGVCSAVTAQGI